MPYIFGKLIILVFRKSILEGLKVSLVKVIPLLCRASVFGKLIFQNNQVLLLCNFSASEHKIQKVFVTLSISMYLGTPLKEIKLIFLLLSPHRYIIFDHFSLFLFIFRLFRGFSYFFYLIIGCNVWKM